MKPYKLLVAVGYHAVNLVALLGTGVLHLVLDRIYGPPQLAAPHGTGAVASRRARQRDSVSALAASPSTSDGVGTAERLSVPEMQAVGIGNTRWGSERVLTAQLVGPQGIVFGAMWVYVHPRLGIARRVLKVTDPHLARALGKDRFEFMEAVLGPSDGAKVLLDQFHVECLRLLDRRKPRHREMCSVPPEGRRPTLTPGSRTVTQLRLAALEPECPSGAPASHATDLTSGGSVVGVPTEPRRVRGDEYQGVVTMAGLTNRNNPDGSPYRTYCLTVNDGSREVPLFGMELERQACDLRIRPGDRVRVIYMGREPLQVPGRPRPSYRNLYQLTRVGNTS
jgi:hypothetical protein